MILHNPHRNETYHIRNVPLEEAEQLSQRGVVFYDYTALTAIDTCPTWGVLRYGLHKTEHAIDGRKLALEAGSACHDFFAALRMWTLINRDKEFHAAINSGNLHRLDGHGIKLFGQQRWGEMLDTPQDSDPQDNATRFALAALHSSGYYDDPSDRKRTMANMEVACITYADRYFKSNMPVLVRGDFIGVEIPFVLEIARVDDSQYQNNPLSGADAAVEIAYYCGRIDGVHQYSQGLIAAENKTAASLNAAWRMSFHMSHQVTGYNVALSAILGQQVNKTVVMGMQIPVPRDVYAGVAFEEVSRTESDFVRWCEWFFEGVAKYEQWKAIPWLAPRYTHSCNRFFSSCMFIPFCTATREEQQELIEGMRMEEWSPLDHLKKKEGENVE